MLVSLYSNIYSTTPIANVEIDVLLNRIREPSEKHKKLVTEARKWRGVDKIKYDAVKHKIMSVSWSGIFLKREKVGLKELSGFVYVDADNCNIDEVKNKLLAISFVKAVWTSVGGKGVGALIPVQGLTTGNFSYTYQKIIKELDFAEFDRLSDFSRYNVLSYDENLVVKPCEPYKAVNPEPRIVSVKPLQKISVDSLFGFDSLKHTIKEILTTCYRKGYNFADGNYHFSVTYYTGLCRLHNLTEHEAIQGLMNEGLISDDFAEKTIKNLYRK